MSKKPFQLFFPALLGWTICVVLVTGVVALYFFSPGILRRPFHIGSEVSERQARTVLNMVVGQTLIEGTAALCSDFGTHPASSCQSSLLRTPQPPGRAPEVVCTSNILEGPFLGATVITLRGKTDIGDIYVTDFVVLDRGNGPEPIDPVYWNGMNLDTDNPYAPQWRFNKRSKRCN